MHWHEKLMTVRMIPGNENRTPTNMITRSGNLTEVGFVMCAERIPVICTTETIDLQPSPVLPGSHSGTRRRRRPVNFLKRSRRNQMVDLVGRYLLAAQLQLQLQRLIADDSFSAWREEGAR